MQNKNRALTGFLLGVIIGAVGTLIIRNVVTSHQTESDKWEEAWANSAAPVFIESAEKRPVKKTDTESDSNEAEDAENDTVEDKESAPEPYTEPEGSRSEFKGTIADDYNEYRNPTA